MYVLFQKPASAVVCGIFMSQHPSQHCSWETPTSSMLSLIAKLINRTSFLFIFSEFCCCGLWLVVTVTLWWWNPSSYLCCIITCNTQTRTHLTISTHRSCCAVSWLATFWAYVPRGALSLQCSVWKLLISTLSPISALCSATARAHRGHIASLDDKTTCFHPVMSQRLWPVTQYKTHQNRLFFSSDCLLFLWPGFTASPKHK